ncbi:lasso peptide biosynthesis B2 protein [Streptomyces noursei]|uniref:lasso peptide biosynthesis B2 protein n=1 Tax=Streptomyces noursei TaxID=1971 RepID=UPI00382299DE
MTQMIHAPKPPPWHRRIRATVALAVALSVRLLPENRGIAARIRIARCARWLPAANPQRVQSAYLAVVACQPPWWRGEIDCKERALATVVAVALTGRRCRLVFGARTLPDAAHSWVATVDGTAIGADEDNGTDFPWTPVYTSP